MKSLIGCLLALLLVVSMAGADNVLKEAEKAVVESVELSLVGGTAGWGAGAYWPLLRSSKVEASAGLFLGFGTEAVGGGLGVRLPVTIPIPVLSNLVDFVAAGGAYNWKESDWGWELWVGNTIPLAK